MYTLYPARSLVHNIGTDASGTHCGVDDRYHVALCLERIPVERIPVVEDEETWQILASFHRSGRRPLRALGRWMARQAGRIFR